VVSLLPVDVSKLSGETKAKARLNFDEDDGVEADQGDDDDDDYDDDDNDDYCMLVVVVMVKYGEI
jgi:hypothetical protein